jgi:ribose/xylose/arabinose/galactoside ABC-type transport system permease subunit
MRLWKSSYSLSGAICGIMGWTLRDRTPPSLLWPGYELDAIAAVVIGGTRFGGTERSWARSSAPSS